MIRLSNRRIPLWAYALLLLVPIVIISFVIARVQTPIDGLGTKMINENSIIIYVQHDSPAEKAGLMPGDTIMMIGDEPVSKIEHMDMLGKFKAGETVPYQLKRDGELISIDVTFNSLWSQNQWLHISFYLLILIVCFTSLMIIYKKPYEITGWLLFIYLQLFAIVQNFSSLYVDNQFVIFGSVIFIFSFNLFGVVLLHFHLLFPGPVSFYIRVRRFINALYLIGALFGLALSILFLRRSYFGTEESIVMFNNFNRWSILWMALTLVLALVLAFYQFKKAKNKSTRKQLRLVVIGSVFGLATPIFYGLCPEFVWRIEHEKQFTDILEIANGAGTYIMTSFLAIAIFRYKLWNIEIYIRLAILYVTATIMILIFYLLLMHIMNILLIEETSLVQFVILAVSSIIFLMFRDILQRFIDRLFYRESYNSTKMVAAFEKQHSGIYNFDELSAVIADSLNNIFHCKSLLFALKKHKLTYSLIQSQGLSREELPAEFNITDETELYILGEKVFSIEEIREKPELFQSSKGELVVPLINEGKAFGILVLGPKLSERSYTLQDVTLLSLLSTRIVALIQTAELYERDLNRHLMLEEERIRIAKDIHDDVGASLTRISMMSELINAKDSDPVAVRQWLQNIADTCREVTQDMTQIIWALSPRSNTFEGLLAYLRRYTREYLEPAEIDCVFHFPDTVEDAQLRPEARRNVYLCVREALHNIVKHSKADKVMITVQNDHNWFTVIVKDNGNGFDPDNLKWQGNGLVNMRNRMKVIEGETTIRAKAGEGAEVLFRIPLKSLP